MPSPSPLSTRTLMRLVALAALNLALFQGTWFLVGFPPITMIALVLNFTLYWSWVRRRPLHPPQLAVILTGFVAATAMVWYFAETRGSPRLAALLLESLPAAVRNRGRAYGPGFTGIMFVEYLILDLCGVATALFFGWLTALAGRRPIGPTQSAPVRSP
jgi:hypothetical protein